MGSASNSMVKLYGETEEKEGLGAPLFTG